MTKYTDEEIEYIMETSETMQKFVLGAEGILSEMDYDTAFRFVLGITQTSQEHISTILNDVVHGKGSDEQLRVIIAHLAPACLLITQTLYSALDRDVLIDKSLFIDELAKRATATAKMALTTLDGEKHAH
jgi:hypothetical protein